MRIQGTEQITLLHNAKKTNKRLNLNEESAYSIEKTTAQYESWNVYERAVRTRLVPLIYTKRSDNKSCKDALVHKM